MLRPWKLIGVLVLVLLTITGCILDNPQVGKSKLTATASANGAEARARRATAAARQDELRATPTRGAIRPSTSGTGEPSEPSRAGNEAAAGETVKLGFHYRPLKNDLSVNELAEKVDFVVLHRTDEEYRDELRAAGYDGPVLQYIRGSEAEGPEVRNEEDDCDAEETPWPNQVADGKRDFCDLIHWHESWFLHNGDGERLFSDSERRFFHMNPGNKGWRDFVAERLKRNMFGDKDTAPLGYDGIFLDNIELSLLKAEKLLDNSDGTVQEYSSDEEFREAWRGWLEHIRDEIGPDVPVWANMIGGRGEADEWNAYIPYLDGFMEEAFVTGYFWGLSVDEQNIMLAQAEHVIEQGKGFYAVSQGNKDDIQREVFALASYLLIMQPHADAYFRYTKANAGYGRWWEYENYDLELGMPLSTRYEIDKGWRRDFEHGYVEVNQVARKGKIVRDK